MSVLGLVVYFILLNTRVKVEASSIAPLWRRAAAFVIDFWFAVFTLGALFGFIDILLEANRTGIFRWHFQRDYLVSADGASLVFVFVSLAAFVGYFLLPLMRRSQTVGGWPTPHPRPSRSTHKSSSHSPLVRTTPMIFASRTATQESSQSSSSTGSGGGAQRSPYVSSSTVWTTARTESCS